MSGSAVVVTHLNAARRANSSGLDLCEEAARIAVAQSIRNAMPSLMNRQDAPVIEISQVRSLRSGQEYEVTVTRFGRFTVRTRRGGMLCQVSRLEF